MGVLSFLGRGGPERPELQLYGKLPIAKDYLRVGCSTGAGLDLRDWLDRTFGSTRSGSPGLVLEAPVRFFGFSQRDPLQGCLWPSSDSGGHRCFPFALFVERKRRAALADLAAGATRAEAVWRRLVDEYGACLAHGDGRELLEARRGSQFDVEGLEPVPSAAVALTSWVAALWPTAGHAGFDRCVAELAAAVRATAVFRLPLVAALPMRDQVLTWRRVLEHVGALERDAWPTFFVPFAPLVAPTAVTPFVAVVGQVLDSHVDWLTATSDVHLGAGDGLALAASRAPDDFEHGTTDLSLARAIEPLLAAPRGTRS